MLASREAGEEAISCCFIQGQGHLALDLGQETLATNDRSFYPVRSEEIYFTYFPMLSIHYLYV